MAVIAKYKFNNTLYDLIPEFNSEFTDYTYTDEVNGNETTRTIESNSLPTLMRFGQEYNNYSTTDNRSNSLIEILNMCTNELITAEKMFKGCTNLTKVSCNWNTSNITNMNYMFYCCHKLNSIDTSNFDTTKVTAMGLLFAECFYIRTLDVSNWNTSNVTNMYALFFSCEVLNNLDTSNWITSNVTNMSNMFDSCRSLTSLNVSNWNTSNVTIMSNMFKNCISLTSLDVSNFDTSKVTNMSNMFENCNSLVSLDLSNWDTSKVTTMYSMFNGCLNLRSLNLRNWNTSSVTNIKWMFSDCESITKLDLSGWDVSNITDMYGLFADGDNSTDMQLKSVDLSNWKLNINVDISDSFVNVDYLNTVLMYNSDTNSINKLIEILPTRTSDNPGKLYIGNISLSSINVSDAESKYWNILKYKGSNIKVNLGNSIIIKASAGNNRLKNIHLGDSNCITSYAKNLGPEFFTQGAIDEYTGELLDSTSETYNMGVSSDFIDMNNFDKLTITSNNAESTNITMAGIATYDSNHNYISYISSYEFSPEITNQYIKENNVRYIRFIAFKVGYANITPEEVDFTLVFK